jgi:hypothetical protein
MNFNKLLRTPDMDCLLCKVNKATKTNSHIISDFLGKSMLGEQNQKVAYIFDTNKLNVRPRKEQDTPKQSFILCPSCEKYFGILEKYFADNIYNRLWDEKFKNEYTVIQEGVIKWRKYKNIEPIIFYLFIYSIVWRCSISTEENFNSFKIKTAEEEELQGILLKYKSGKLADLMTFINSNNSSFPFYEYKLITAETFKNKMENFYFHTLPDETGDINSLIFNEFSLHFSLFSQPEKPVAIGFLKSEDWDRCIKLPIMKLDANQLIEKVKETGETPWLLKKENIGNF